MPASPEDEQFRRRTRQWLTENLAGEVISASRPGSLTPEVFPRLPGRWKIAP